MGVFISLKWVNFVTYKTGAHLIIIKQQQKKKKKKKNYNIFLTSVDPLLSGRNEYLFGGIRKTGKC